MADLEGYVPQFEQFFTSFYQKEVERILKDYPKNRSIEVDFKDLLGFDVDLANALNDSPDDLIKAAETAVEGLKIATPSGDAFKPHVRFFGIPDRNLLVEQIGSRHLNKFFSFKGLIGRRGDVLNKAHKLVYKCGSCSERFELVVIKDFTPPSKCPICKKGFLKEMLDESKFLDMQRIEVQDMLERVRSGSPTSKVICNLEDDLVNKIIPGDNVEVSGILRISPNQGKNKSHTVFSKHVDIVHIRKLKKDFEDIPLTKEDEAEILKLAAREDLEDMITNSIAPDIWGYREIKKALALQLFGGTKDKITSGGSKIRDDIHVLLVGDPGIAKTRFLQQTVAIALKSIYVSGKSVSGVGLTASAEKDELSGEGWTLKAGALVLASGGIAAIDEFDKIDDEDRGSLHEVMESQSYHFNTKIMLSDGIEMRIGELVEGLMAANRDKIMAGKDCLILREGIGGIRLLTTDFSKISETAPYQISKHKAPEYFIKVVMQTGREVLVTPEHPFWVVENGEVMTKPAEELTAKDYTLMPRRLPLSQSREEFRPELLKVTGYHITDGGYELNRGCKNGINFYNKDDDLIDDYSVAATASFGVAPYFTERAGTGVKAVRMISMGALRQMELLHPSLVGKGADKIVPPQFMSAKPEHVSAMLRAMFDSDGTFSEHYIGLVGENRFFIEQVQTLLLRFGIRSHMFADGNVFRLTITGRDNIQRYRDSIGFLGKKKRQRLDEYLKKETRNMSTTDVVPGCAKTVLSLLKKLKIDENSVLGYGLYSQRRGFCFTRRNFEKVCATMRKKVDALRAAMGSADNCGYDELIMLRRKLNLSQYDIEAFSGIKRATVSYWECRKIFLGRYRSAIKAMLAKMLENEGQFRLIERFATGDIGFVAIRKTEKVRNENEAWVYDVTVRPTQAFISECAVLHNTVSIAKAGIVATLRAKTAIVAAANPKFGRFQQNKHISEQFDIPPSLLSRFDLIFPILDILDVQRDERLADHILGTHLNALDSREDRDEKTEKREDIISTDVLRKYIAYAKKNINPRLTAEAAKAIKEFYLSLRSLGQRTGSVPITPRYLEGLVRLAEANAKLRLSDTVQERDAKVAVDIMNYVMKAIMTDQETGRIDVDIISTGRSQSEREKIIQVMDIVKELSSQYDAVEVEMIIQEAKGVNIEEGKTRRIIDELMRNGEIYFPKHGFVKVVTRD